MYTVKLETLGTVIERYEDNIHAALQLAADESEREDTQAAIVVGAMGTELARFSHYEVA